MLIDWFTVGVQIVNFLILVGLLKHFLYAPVLKAMDTRQKTIAAHLAEAARLEQEGRERLALLAMEKEALLNSQEQLRLKAQQEIEAWRETTLASLKGDMEEIRQRWRRQVTDEQAAFLENLKIRISEQVVRMARKVLADLGDEQLEARLITLFLAQMAEAPKLPEQHPRQALGDLQLTTGRPLAKAERERLQNGLAAMFGPKISTLSFTEDPGLGFGLRLTTGDHKWEWNLARYLVDLEQEIRQAFTTAIGEKS